MYYPFLRGKQYELILLRDHAAFLKENNIHPIIEPVKRNTTALKKAISALVKEGVEHTLIVNPQVGDYSTDDIPDDSLDEILNDNSVTALGFLLHAETEINEIRDFLDNKNKCCISLIHYGFTDGKALVSAIDGNNKIKYHIFIEDQASEVYRIKFKQKDVQRILIRDGFRTRERNANYPLSEHFSDLHITYTDKEMDGFGDFLIAGDDYRESGGPAYAVAIHLTYIDNGNDQDMFIYHFISDQTDSPTNPGGKFLQALEKMVNECKRRNSKIFDTTAVQKYSELYETKHYPGLGFVKKLSMLHHVELIANYLEGIN